MNVGGNTGNFGMFALTSPYFAFANYVIPSQYRNYNYIKIAGTGNGIVSPSYLGFSEINLLLLQ